MSEYFPYSCRSVSMVDVMPRLAPVGQTADFAIVQVYSSKTLTTQYLYNKYIKAARVSYGAGTKKVSEDTGLIRYLLRHQHTTPFEMVEFKFHCVMRIFLFLSCFVFVVCLFRP